MSAGAPLRPSRRRGALSIEQTGAPRLAGADPEAAAPPVDPDIPDDGPADVGDPLGEQLGAGDREGGQGSSAPGWTSAQVEGFIRTGTGALAMYYGSAHIARPGEFEHAAEALVPLFDRFIPAPSGEGAGGGLAALMLAAGDVMGYATEPERIAEREEPHGPLARLLRARQPNAPGPGIAPAAPAGRAPRPAPAPARRPAAAAPSGPADPESFRWTPEEQAVIEQSAARRAELESLGMEV